jgi:hypothetical protein
MVFGCLVLTNLWRFNRYFSFKTVTKCIVVYVLITWVNLLHIRIQITSNLRFVHRRIITLTTFKLRPSTLILLIDINLILIICTIHILLLVMLRYRWCISCVWCLDGDVLTCVHLHGWAGV